MYFVFHENIIGQYGGYCSTQIEKEAIKKTLLEFPFENIFERYWCPYLAWLSRDSCLSQR